MLPNRGSDVLYDAEATKNLSFGEVFCLDQMGRQNPSVITF